MEEKPLNRYDLPDTCQIVSNAVVSGLASSIRRAKFPMAVDLDDLADDLTSGIESIAKASPGSGHDQWLTGVNVQFDLTFSVKAWTELERYHFVDFISSQSTMHRITKFDLDKPGTYIKYTDPRMIQIMKELVDNYNELQGKADAYQFEYEELKPEQDDEKLAWQIYRSLQQEASAAYLKILYSNPCGFRLTAGMTTNYRQLKTIYLQRRFHRLPEWREFCAWIETLPFSELITGGEK